VQNVVDMCRSFPKDVARRMCSVSLDGPCAYVQVVVVV